MKDWFRKTENETGMNKTAIITGIVMSFLLKSNNQGKNTIQKNRGTIQKNFPKR